MNKINLYLQDVMKEMKKVSWPSWPELRSATVATLVASLIVALIIYGFDQIISAILDIIYA